MVATAGTLGRPGWSIENRFYAGMTLTIFAAVFLGFSQSFFLRPWFPDRPVPPEPYFYFHGTVFVAWFALLVVQPLLVASGRLAVHRRLGKIGAVLAAAMVIVGTYGALLAAARPAGFVGMPVPALVFLAVPAFDMVLFAGLVGAAIAKRSDPQSHKRLMLIASISIISAAIARWPLDAVTSGGLPVFFALTDLFLVPLVIWDLVTRRRLHGATLWGGLLLIGSQPLRLWLSGTAAWLAFAHWAVGLLA